MRRPSPVAACLATLVACADPPSPVPAAPQALVPVPTLAPPPSAAVAVDAAAAGPVVATGSPSPSETAPFPPLPDGARVSTFRSVLVGMLPYPSRRQTWTLATAGSKVVLRLESAVASPSFRRVDATTHDPAKWVEPLRAAWEGTLADPRRLSAFEVKLTFGPVFGGGKPRPPPPATLAFVCKLVPIRVHPSNAELRRGGKRDDDTMSRATWAPPQTDAVVAPLCTPTPAEDGASDVLLSFTSGLLFAPERKGPHAGSPGVEWAFANDDMALQEGGYRWLPEATAP